MKRCSLFFLAFLALTMLLPFPAPGADIGFGIPDMVEEKVEELDKKVRRFKARQPEFEFFSPIARSRANSDSDVLVTSTIGDDEKRVYFVYNFHDPDEIRLYQVDAEGKPIARSTLITPPDIPFIGQGDNADTFHQLSISPQGNVDALASIASESGPIAVFFRKSGTNQMFNVQGFPRFFAGEDTAVDLDSFTYDSNRNIYVAGDSGVFSILPNPITSDTIIIDRWNAKYFEAFNVPKEGLIARGDRIFVSSHEGTAGGADTVVLTALNADSSIAWSDTIVHDIPGMDPYNSTSHLLAGDNHLYLHYQQDRSGTDAIFKYDYDDGSGGNSGGFNLPGANAHFHPTVVSSGGMIYGGSKGGTVVRINGNSLGSGFSKRNDLSDSRVEVNLLSNENELVVGTLNGDSGAIYTLDSSNLNADLLVSNADTAPFSLSAAKDFPFNPGKLMRAVWLKDSFIGGIFYGTSIFWRDITMGTTLMGTKLEVGPWPHEDANNQRQRNVQ